jgi:hypothetical protein
MFRHLLRPDSHRLRRLNFHGTLSLTLAERGEPWRKETGSEEFAFTEPMIVGLPPASSVEPTTFWTSLGDPPGRKVQSRQVYTPLMRPKQSISRDRRVWMSLIIGLALVFQTGIARADAVVRKPSESDDDFMARVLGPSSELAQKVVRSTEIARGKVTLIGFVNAKDNSLVGHLLIETSPGHYEHVTFPSCDEEGGAPDLLAVFFARTAKDGGRDLAVLCHWDVQHAVAQGDDYAAQFYRLQEKGSKMVVEPVTELNTKFDTADVSQTDEHGKWHRGSKAKFKTVAEVKKLLNRMGLKQ